MSDEIQTYLHCASLLYASGSTESAQPDDLRGVLVSRLHRYYEFLDISNTDLEENLSLEQVQLVTAREALNVIEHIHRQLIVQLPKTAHGEQSQPTAGPDVGALGNRDLGHLRALVGIAFKWGTSTLLNRVVILWRNNMPVTDNGLHADYVDLLDFLTRMSAILLSDGVQGTLSESHVTATVLNRHMPDLFSACITLGWLPVSLSSDSTPVAHHLRPILMKFLSILQPSQAISTLGTVLRNAIELPPHVRKTCLSLLNRQIVRRNGVRGLCISVFGDEDILGEDAPLEKLEEVSRVLRSALPRSMPIQDYYSNIVHQVWDILSDESSSVVHQRAAAFALSRILSADDTAGTVTASDIALPLLHYAFLSSMHGQPPASHSSMTVSTSLEVLTKLLLNTEPSPNLISKLFTPIAPHVFCIWCDVDRNKTADPAVKERTRSLLTTWGRVATAQEAVDALWRVINGEGGRWKTDVAGHITVYISESNAQTLSMLTPQELKRIQDDGGLDMNSNILDLRPDPTQLVQFIRSIDRPDVSSELLFGILEVYKKESKEESVDPFRKLLLLQIATQMQSEFSTPDARSSVLKDSHRVLTFVKHVLETTDHQRAPQVRRYNRAADSLTMDSLRIVSSDENVELDDEDSDDEPDRTPEDEMVSTAIELLLATLEGNPGLSAHTDPLLDDIFDLLHPYADSSSETLRPLAREARIVMTARLASSSSATPAYTGSSKKTDDNAEEIYQKALKLLQDPLLPVRAHGLMLLRQLVSRRPGTSAGSAQALNPALKPAILSIFTQSVQDDDSYIFLNAVQGLSALVEAYGKDVLKSLVELYAGGIDGLRGSSMTQGDLDKRLRVGEALEQVIHSCGQALPVYADYVVPPLMLILRTSHMPTTLRTSSLSLLAQCATTSPMSLMKYAPDIMDATVDLLQVETTSRTGDTDVGSMHTQPTSTHSKFPPLRRAALHLFQMVVRACALQTDSDLLALAFTSGVAKRAKTTLNYVASTDEDTIVRVMAREAMDDLNDLGRALLGT